METEICVLCFILIIFFFIGWNAADKNRQMDSGDDEKLVFDSIFGVFSFCFVFEELIENIVIARNY